MLEWIGSGPSTQGLAFSYYLSHIVAARFVCVCFFWGEYKCRYNLLQRLREACVHTDLAPVYAVAVAVASCFGLGYVLVHSYQQYLA